MDKEINDVGKYIKEESELLSKKIGRLYIQELSKYLEESSSGLIPLGIFVITHAAINEHILRTFIEAGVFSDEEKGKTLKEKIENHIVEINKITKLFFKK